MSDMSKNKSIEIGNAMQVLSDALCEENYNVEPYEILGLLVGELIDEEDAGEIRRTMDW